MSEFSPELYAADIASYLKSRFHPGKPHIGTIGTLSPDQESDDISLENPFEETESEYALVENKKNTPAFTFVPNHASYVIYLDDQKKWTTTRIMFFIRIAEGTEEDINPPDNRPRDYALSREELEKSFRKYEIEISFNEHLQKQDVKIKVDDKSYDPSRNDGISKFKIKERNEKNSFTTYLEISDESDPFMVQLSDRLRGLASQKYKILIGRTLVQNADGHIVKTEIRNFTHPSPESVHPVRKWKPDGSTYESEKECLERYSGKISEADLLTRWKPRIFEMEDRWMPGGNTYGRMLEFEMEELSIDCKSHPYHDPKNEKFLEHVVNLVYDEKLERGGARFIGSVKYQDYLLFKEKIPSMSLGLSPSDLFANLKFSELLSKAFDFPNFWKFQEDSIMSINESAAEDKDTATLISARTGGGKTEAFMFPILNYCIQRIFVDKNEIGTKAIIFYPTKALANDQASRIISLLYKINKLEIPRKITIGILHGDVPKSEDDPEWDSSIAEGIPFECPACKTGTLVPKNNKEVFCNTCNESLDFVYSLTRRPIYSNPPDILISNPDTLQFDLMLKPEHHGIFGRKIFACENCSRPYSFQKRTCFCNDARIVQKNPTPPKFVVFDEIHMFGGTFGINTSYLLSRINYSIKKYARIHHERNSHSITMVASSATISNAKDFSRIFFNLPESSIKFVPANNDVRESYYLGEGEEKSHRYHLFIMPYSYRPISTLSKAVGYAQERHLNGMPPNPFYPKYETHEKPLQILGFVNNLSDSTSLISSTQREFRESLGFIEVSGHTTDFDTNLRSKAEKGFNKQEVHVIFATPTLEVGVDFRVVNCVAIFGFPFSFNEYVQRIGRGGRNENSLIITICQPWKPIDQFFYSDAKKKISQQHKNMEPIPITRDNPDAVQKHLMASVFDIVSSKEDAEKIIGDLRLLDIEVTGQEDRISEEAFKILGLNDVQIEQSATNFKRFIKGISDVTQNQIKKDEKMSLGKKFFDDVSGFNVKHGLTNLRSTEDSVAIEVSWDVTPL